MARGERRRPAAKLTKRHIDGLAYQGGWDIAWDTLVPGFGVRIYESGKKAFIFSYRLGRQKRTMVLGRWGSGLTVDQAREQAGRHLVAVRDGKDPLDQRAEGRRQGTLRELAEAYFGDREARGRKTVARMRKRLFRNVPKSWLSRRAADITRPEIRALHGSIGRRAPYEANRTLEIIRPMYRKGLSAALDDPETGLWFFAEGAINPAEEVDPFPEQKRKRFVRETELPALVEQIDQHSNIYVRGALWCYLLIGARKEEILRACRARHQSQPYVDWTHRTLEVPDPKSGEQQSVPLSGPAMAVLQAMPMLEGNPYIFAGRREGAHLVNIDKAWRAIRAAAGLEDVRLHDLRRTVGSWLTRAGVDLNVIKDALRHASLSTTLTYARLGEEPARAALEDHGRRVLEIAGRRVVAADDEAG